ncbi:hypothetical protein PBOI14_65180 [Pseudomonas sp. Boi14]|nr:hypothetical protein PBOI14_65180 [Pseudomonas sp. Boi14]
MRPGLKFAIEPNSTFSEVDAKSSDLGIAYGLDGQYAESRVSLICPRCFPSAPRPTWPVSRRFASRRTWPAMS